MFYLKYRPKNVGEIDNSRVKDVFKHILESEQVPHAMLFIGQKGTGKTSMARIFAKAVNCLENRFSKKNSSFEPCNNCSACRSIEGSSSPDVIELDAASNRGIEDIKNLIRETAFLPMVNAYRVFIIDEAHMITPDAFNALLKTLEEPPANVIFILATTNQEKIPKTIASRCSIINFGKAKQADIVHMLQRITEKEKIKVAPEVLKLISMYSDQSFRDAAKTYEELVTQGKLDHDSAKTYLGLSKTSLLETVSGTDLQKSLLWIHEFGQANGNFKNLIEQLLQTLHLLLLQEKGVTVDEVSRVTFSTQETVRLMKLLTEAYANLKVTPVESIPLEIAIVEFYNQRNKL